MSLVMGIDIGSSTAKGVLVRDRKLIGYSIIPSGTNYKDTVQKLRELVLAEAGSSVSEVDCTVTTGLGSRIIPFGNQVVSDLDCCAAGIHFIFPSVRGVVDIQRQSSQVINLDENGQVTDFAVSEICASGSGYFLEVIANVLQIPIPEIGPLSLKSQNPITFTTGCAVFGESEAISRVSEGIPKEDILAGVHQALFEKISVLAHKIGLQEQYAVCGGGALNTGMVKQIEKLGVQVVVPPQPQIINALGAALLSSTTNN